MEVIVNILAMTIPFSVALLLASIGEMFNQRSGVFNLGCEGIMALGAFVGMLIPFLVGKGGPYHFITTSWALPWLPLREPSSDSSSAWCASPSVPRRELQASDCRCLESEPPERSSGTSSAAPSPSRACPQLRSLCCRKYQSSVRSSFPIT